MPRNRIYDSTHGFKCEKCEDYVCNACRVECFTCGEHSLHEECAYEIGDNWYCEDHTEECDFCENRMPTDNITICSKCEEKVCDECRVDVDTEIFCRGCVEELENE